MRVQRELEDATREVVVVPPDPSRVAACIEAALPTKSIASYVRQGVIHLSLPFIFQLYFLSMTIFIMKIT